MILWPSFQFNSPQFNELTFDHWLVVEAQLVPIDEFCVSGALVWEVRLEVEMGLEVGQTAALAERVELAAAFGFQIELAGAIPNPVNLAAELKCC